MKPLLCLALLGALIPEPGWSATSINAVNRFAYGANVGWMDWRGDGANGAEVGEFVCRGFIYAANVGWIHLGSGIPANGIQYQNNAANDFGINHVGVGDLRGYAYGANIGWVRFENAGAPRVDLATGNLTGFAWGANIGWISLSNAMAYVQTDVIRMGADTDGDGIPDAWELIQFGNLGTANGTTDNDGDGFKDISEYLADTNPLDVNSLLRITNITVDPSGSPVDLTWTSRATRRYRIEHTEVIAPVPTWLDVGLSFILPDPGLTTTRSFASPSSPSWFYRVEASKPLAP